MELPRSLSRRITFLAIILLCAFAPSASSTARAGVDVSINSWLGGSRGPGQTVSLNVIAQTSWPMFCGPGLYYAEVWRNDFGFWEFEWFEETGEYWSTFTDYSPPQTPDDLTYYAYVGGEDCGWIDGQDDEFVDAEDAYPDYIEEQATANDPCNGCTYDGTVYTFRVMSQWPNVAITNTSWDEQVGFGADTCNDQVIFNWGGGGVDASGDFQDWVYYCMTAAHPCCQAGSCQLEVNRVWRVHDRIVSTSLVNFTCTGYWIEW